MRPGPHPWATNNLYVGGPDVGSNSKTETIALLREDGYYPERRPAPDLLNWQLNRNFLAHQYASSLFAANWFNQDTNAAFLAANDQCVATNCVIDTATGLNISAYFADTVVAGNLVEVRGVGGVSWSTVASSPVVALPGAVVIVDSDADDSIAGGQRGVVANSAGGTDQVYTANGWGGGAWGASAIVGAPALNFQAIGCDRNTPGAANATWLIGDDAGGGNGALYVSTNAGANYAAVPGPGWPAVAEPILFIGHTCHPAGALGPDDAGNTSWLIFTTTRVLYSADGATWANNAHPAAGYTPAKKAAAYSRTAGRWVMPENNGDVHYSDDHGASWTTLATALVGTVGATMQCRCDAYGTFVVMDDVTRVWISTDDGLNWSRIRFNVQTSTSEELEAGFYSQNDWDTHGQFPTFFTVVSHNDGTTTRECWRSLGY